MCIQLSLKTVSGTNLLLYTMCTVKQCSQTSGTLTAESINISCKQIQCYNVAATSFPSVLFCKSMLSWGKVKVINPLLTLNPCVSVTWRKLCSFESKEISLQTSGSRNFSLQFGEEREIGEWKPVPSAVTVYIASCYRSVWGGGQDFLLSLSEQQFPSALSLNFKVEFVLYCRPISTLGAWLVGA